MKKNKVLQIFMATLLLISIQISVIAATVGVVNVDTVRIREKPSTTNSKIVGLVSIGDKVTIIGEENNWYKVKAEDDHGKAVQGYIRKDLLTVDGKTTIITPTENNNDNNNQEKPTENNNNSTTVENPKQEEPNTNTETPEIGTVEETTSENIEVNTQKNDITISTIKITGEASKGRKIQLSNETKIKILPSANSSNIAKLAISTEVTIIESIKGWCRIEAGEHIGWVRIDQ